MRSRFFDFHSKCDKNVHCAVKTVFYLTLDYFLRTPDNSNLFSISLEGSSYRELTVSHIGRHIEISQKAPKKTRKTFRENNRHTGQETSLDASEKQNKLIANSDHLPEISVEKAHSNRETYKSSEDDRKV